jgi:mono/diheme cytochrome c family protein
MNKKVRIISTLLLTASLTACGGKEDSANTASAKKVEGRWYTSAQLIRGKKVFKENCAVCHGEKGQGLVVDWKKTDAAGKFPPPPLNGSAHTWHHSKDLLMRTVNEGGIALGGTMPSFKDKLTDQEKEAVLAHVMSLWPKEVYEIWQKRNPATK